MLFWITCMLLSLVSVAYVMAPLLRADQVTQEAPDVVVYKAQLAEVERDLARGVLDPAEAERTRAEVARRLLSASRQTVAESQATPALNRAMVAVIAVAAPLIAVVAYLDLGAPGEPDQPLAARHAMAAQMRENRPNQAAFEAAAPAIPQIDAPADYLESVAQLRAIVPTRPDDLRGWELLAFHETELRQYSAAAKAQAQVITLKGGGEMADLQRLVDLMVAAANGQVSPEAEAVVREMLRRDETNVPARYYLGLLNNLTDRPDIAFALWRPLVESGEDSFHVALARELIDDAAFRAGVEYTPPMVRGPGADDIAAAENMTEEDRQAMIANMVAGLADRLANEGGPASDWARLITAYGVLGNTVAAAEIWAEARVSFATDDTAMALLRKAAQSAGVAE